MHVFVDAEMQHELTVRHVCRRLHFKRGDFARSQNDRRAELVHPNLAAGKFDLDRFVSVLDRDDRSSVKGFTDRAFDIAHPIFNLENRRLSLAHILDRGKKRCFTQAIEPEHLEAWYPRPILDLRELGLQRPVSLRVLVRGFDGLARSHDGIACQPVCVPTDRR
ncbi:hypothetical protein [Rubripirellula lacrimiformis]|uniref:hypothetical protein n=1 Tax=Rubripirellula lacrimiformis TaxID=1930273 RepID=UPI00119D0B45|nr:hypothetical protein [Rubripirellula lacrimiformis]